LDLGQVHEFPVAAAERAGGELPDDDILAGEARVLPRRMRLFEDSMTRVGLLDDARPEAADLI